VLAILICAIAVMLFVEIPVVALFVRPAAVAAGIERFHDWLRPTAGGSPPSSP
jgi:uncharacterized protein involved in cysteine biosynthesis